MARDQQTEPWGDAETPGTHHMNKQTWSWRDADTPVQQACRACQGDNVSRPVSGWRTACTHAPVHVLHYTNRCRYVSSKERSRFGWSCKSWWLLFKVVQVPVCKVSCFVRSCPAVQSPPPAYVLCCVSLLLTGMIAPQCIAIACVNVSCWCPSVSGRSANHVPCFQAFCAVFKLAGAIFVELSRASAHSLSPLATRGICSPRAPHCCTTAPAPKPAPCST